MEGEPYPWRQCLVDNLDVTTKIEKSIELVMIWCKNLCGIIDKDSLFEEERPP